MSVLTAKEQIYQDILVAGESGLPEDEIVDKWQPLLGVGQVINFLGELVDENRVGFSITGRRYTDKGCEGDSCSL